MHRVRCRMCGRAFQTPNRSYRYCSDACRRAGRRAAHGRGSARPRMVPKPSGGKAECRMCGRPFTAPTRTVRYCSDACRADGGRARGREGVRRCLADPKRRALQAARVGAVQARRRAAAAEGRTRRVQCGVCERGFATPRLDAVHCSGPCRKNAAAARGRRRRVLAGTPEAAKCRVCSAQFEPGHGGGTLGVLCVITANQKRPLLGRSGQESRPYSVFAPASLSLFPLLFALLPIVFLFPAGFRSAPAGPAFACPSSPLPAVWRATAGIGVRRCCRRQAASRPLPAGFPPPPASAAPRGAGACGRPECAP